MVSKAFHCLSIALSPIKLLNLCRRRKNGEVSSMVFQKPEPISVEEMEDAKGEIIKFVQGKSFRAEISSLATKQQISDEKMELTRKEKRCHAIRF